MFPEYEIVLSQGVLVELERLSKTAKKNSRDARTALLLLKNSDFSIEDDSSHVDKWILGRAIAGSSTVCTNDAKLKAALRSKGIAVVSLAVDGRLR